MKSYALKGLILASIVSLLLISCGGGGGSNFAGGGIDGTGVMSAGVVSAFGSIVVNGMDFDTSKAEIIINGVLVGVGDEFVADNLAVGMVVTVEGRVFEDESAVADRVLYSSNVVGPVESVGVTDPVTNEKEIVVLGQSVVVNFITRFRPDTYGFDIIAPDDVVVVSGYRDFDGKIRATYIEDITDPTITVFEVTGFVESLDDPAPNTFMINGLTIDYSSIPLDDLPDNFANGLIVEVVGELDDISGNLIADEITLADEAVGEEVEEIEIMGYVTEIISENGIIKFKIGNQEVHADMDEEIVEYVDGEPDDIAPGQRIEAEGDFEGGVLVAWEIEFWKPDQIEVEGIVDQVYSISGFPEFTFEERDDQLFQTNTETEFEDIDRGDIEAGIELEVKGVPQNPELSVIKADKVSFELE
jgi:hypothetical protein